MEFYVKTIHSVSSYFSREDNEYNKNVKINITEADESEQEILKHLVITGINGTGKTVLLDRINQALREKFTEVTGYDIECNPNEDVDIELTYCESKPVYFEPLFITVDDMFMPTRRENFNDYVNFFFKISKSSESILSDLKKGLSELYGEDFVELDIENEQIKLKKRNPFGIKNMSSGHYSFLNIYCRMKFTQFAFQWEYIDENIWGFLYTELSKCTEISETLVNKLKEIKIKNQNETGTNSRALDATIESEVDRKAALDFAVNIARSRYEVKKSGVGERSRARDRDIALKVSQSLHLSNNETYEKILKTNKDIDTSFRELAEKLKPCADILLTQEIEANNYPLIILIDEPESHLHIALQREILPYLVKCFKNAQFIVATHSPFVITSLPNATLFNMENRQTLSGNLTKYSYESVVEEWFGIYLCSDEAKVKFERFKFLADSSEKLDGKTKEEYIKLYLFLVETDLITQATQLNSRKQLKDGEVYVLRGKRV